MTIFGEDKRERVTNTSEPPWRHVCAIRITADDGSQFVASGALIGPRTVLTSADVLRPAGALARAVTVTPALDGEHAPFGTAAATTPQLRFDAEDPPRFAAIVLGDDSFANIDWFTVAVLPDDELRGADLFVGGYPADTSYGRQYYDVGRARLLEPDRISYDIDTYGGQSGSPVWTTIGGRHVIVGVHNRGGSTLNSGDRITQAALATITDWRKAFVPSPPAPPIESTLSLLLDRVGAIEAALQTLIGRLPPTRAELDRQLKLDLADALLRIPDVDRSVSRTVLITGIPFVSIREVNPRTDIINLLQDIERVDPPAFLILIDNARRSVAGTELAGTLQMLAVRYEAWLSTRRPTK